jgi:quercetin dioxygenase-like cupin family protein
MSHLAAAVALAFALFTSPPVLDGSPATTRVVRPPEAPAYKIADGKGKVELFLHAANSTEAALSQITLQWGAVIPEHVHESSAEILFVEEGEVVMQIDGRTEVVVGPAAIRIPAGVKHSAKVISKSKRPVRAIQVYVGPGPEQRFTLGEKLPE